MTEAKPSGCGCQGGVKLIFPCSGSADVGALADQAARRLSREGQGKMFCLAGVGGRVSGIMASTAAAERILVIDGCPLECAKHTLEQAGFKNYTHLRLAELGLPKGQSPVNEENIGKIAAAGAEILG